MVEKEPLIPKHGGYRRLKSFQVAQLVYDVTVRFCELYVDRFSRTRDQMVQAARSGVQNIAEGSQASATSKKTELKLTNVARASLEELRLDYEDFLRQRGLPLLAPDHPVLVRFKRRRCASLEEVQAWVAEKKRRSDAHGHSRTWHGRHPPQESVLAGPWPSVFVLGVFHPGRQRRSFLAEPILPPPRPPDCGPG
ncbi:MAG: four helix bundle protein [Desulfobacteraceae bacterium]|nr:four helix bundle protein [Desulfobacteraceae bacterium]